MNISVVRRVRSRRGTGSISQIAHQAVRVLLGLNGAFIYVFYLAPLVILVIFSFNSASRIMPPMEGVSLRWYQSALDSRLLVSSVVNSGIVALVTGAIGTTLATLAGYGLYQFPSRFRRVVEVAAALPLVCPALVYGVALLIFLHTVGVRTGLPTIVLGHVTATLPFSFLIIMNVGFSNLDRSLEEASLDLGATRFTTLRRVILPIIQPAILSAFLFSAIISFNELILAFFLAGTGNTLPVFVWSQFQRGLKPIINATSSLIIVCTILIMLALFLFLRLRPRTATPSARGASRSTSTRDPE
jgi:ABC-type spermidine/putrescine transport system permease subunit II